MSQPKELCVNCGQKIGYQEAVLDIPTGYWYSRATGRNCPPKGMGMHKPEAEVTPRPAPAIEMGCAEIPRGDGFCRACGRANDVIWSVPNEIWNRLYVVNPINILCVECLMKKADDAGIGNGSWQVFPEGYLPPVICMCDTPRRSWNPEWLACLGCGGRIATRVPAEPPAREPLSYQLVKVKSEAGVELDVLEVRRRGFTDRRPPSDVEYDQLAIVASLRAQLAQAETERDALREDLQTREKCAAFVMRDCPTHGETPKLKELTAKLSQTEAERDDARRALESFTPSGSEFVNDVKRCKEFIRERIDMEHNFMIKAVKERKQTEAALRIANLEVEGIKESDVERYDEARLERRRQRWLTQAAAQDKNATT